MVPLRLIENLEQTRQRHCTLRCEALETIGEAIIRRRIRHRPLDPRRDGSSSAAAHWVKAWNQRLAID